MKDNFSNCGAKLGMWGGGRSRIGLGSMRLGFHIGWAASEFLMRMSKFLPARVKVNMTPNGEHQIIRPDQSQIFDAGVNFLSLRHQCENPYSSVLTEPLAGHAPDAYQHVSIHGED